MIKIFTTGGTIGGLEYENAEDKAGQRAIDISNFLETANISFEYKIETLFDKDSRHITGADRELLVDNIIQSKENKILITHGTYTMAETARFLGKLNLKKTIVLVGSFILGTVNYTDGKISTNSLNITAVSNVDGASSTKIRVTVIPKSNDVVPVRNQLLEIDLVNSTIAGSVDAQATTGKGYTVTSTGTTTTTSVSTTSSTPTSSAY